MQNSAAQVHNVTPQVAWRI